MRKPSQKETTKNKEPEDNRSFLQRVAVRKGKAEALLLPALAVFTALLIGSLLIAFSDLEVLAAWGQFFSNPLRALGLAGQKIFQAYEAMFSGAFGRPTAVIAAIKNWQLTGETRSLLDAIRPFAESLVIATPYIFAGLGVALGFRGGLFNIGAEGQLFVAALASVYVGYSITGVPFLVHTLLALLVGVLAGALWGAIPGFLKARTGAHEVINTIMMNYIAFRLTDYMLNGPMQRPDGMPITNEILPSAYIPSFFEPPVRVHWGFLLALGMAFLMYWFLWKTPLGMEIRMVGANPRGARYAGIRVTVIIALTMALSGAVAGMAGATQILGLEHKLVRSFSSGYGFDAIALALLGNSHPFGVVLASLLFGFLRGGAARMQSVAGTPVELIRIIQGMIILFIAAPEIIRSLYRIKKSRQKKGVPQSSTS